jgi:hypothetical protein
VDWATVAVVVHPALRAIGTVETSLDDRRSYASEVLTLDGARRIATNIEGAGPGRLRGGGHDVIDPITAAFEGRRVAKALLRPNGKVDTHVARA